MKKAILFALILMLAIDLTYATGNNPVKKGNAFSNAGAKKDTLKIPAKTPWEFEIVNTFTSSYFWRGLEFNKGIMYQPELSITKGNWTLTNWSNVVLKETGGNEFVPELDFTFQYENEIQNFSYQPNLNIYFYPSNYSNIYTAEIGGVFKYNMQPVGFYFSPSYDFVSNLGGYYMDYGLFREDSINRFWSLETKLLMGYGNKMFNTYYAPTENTLGAESAETLPQQSSKSLRVEIKAEYKLTDRVSFKPQLIAFRTFSDGNNYSQPLVRFNGAVSLVYGF